MMPRNYETAEEAEARKARTARAAGFVRLVEPNREPEYEIVRASYWEAGPRTELYATWSKDDDEDTPVQPRNAELVAALDRMAAECGDTLAAVVLRRAANELREAQS